MQAGPLDHLLRLWQLFKRLFTNLFNYLRTVRVSELFALALGDEGDIVHDKVQVAQSANIEAFLADHSEWSGRMVHIHLLIEKF